MMSYVLAYFTLGFILAVVAVAWDERNRDLRVHIFLLWPVFVCIFGLAALLNGLAHVIVAVAIAVRRAVE